MPNPILTGASLVSNAVIPGSGAVLSVIAGLFSGLRGRTQHMGYAQAIATGNQFASRMQPLLKQYLSVESYSYVSAQYLPRFLNFLRYPPAGAGITYDWWPPIGYDNNIALFSQSEVGLDRRVLVGLDAHMFYIAMNVDVDGGASPEHLRAILASHLRIMFPEIPTTEVIQGGEQGGGGAGGNGGGVGSPIPPVTTTAKAGLSMFLVLGLAGAFIYSFFIKKGKTS